MEQVTGELVNKRRGQETKTSLKQMKGEGDLNTGGEDTRGI